jgi:hypothetical protein
MTRHRRCKDAALLAGCALVISGCTGGYLSQPESGSAYGSAQIERSLVIGQTLWTVSAAGAMANDLTTIRQVAWIPFTREL